jgi:hypothetical protein
MDGVIARADGAVKRVAHVTTASHNPVHIVWTPAMLAKQSNSFLTDFSLDFDGWEREGQEAISVSVYRPGPFSPGGNLCSLEIVCQSISAVCSSMLVNGMKFDPYFRLLHKPERLDFAMRKI